MTLIESTQTHTRRRTHTLTHSRAAVNPQTSDHPHGALPFNFMATTRPCPLDWLYEPSGRVVHARSAPLDGGGIAKEAGHRRRELCFYWPLVVRVVAVVDVGFVLPHVPVFAN